MDGKTKNKINELANGKNLDFNIVSNFYYMEQFTRRIAKSKYREDIILKGGFLISHLDGDFFRTTKDIDATLKNLKFKEEELVKIFSDICAINLDDGINFEFDYIEPNQETKEYGGFAMKIQYSKKGKIYFDVSCGDTIYPAVETKPIKSFFGDYINVLSYPVETIIAEKYASILSHGIGNTRMRDFGDLYTFIKVYDIDLVQVKGAIELTCENRGIIGKLKEAEGILNAKKAYENENPFWPRYVIQEKSFSDVSFDDIINEIIEFSKHLNFIKSIIVK